MRGKDMDLKIANISMNKIDDNPFQPRQKYQKKGLKLLAKSISERGLLHPISVVKVSGRYVIVGGHRRYRAFKILRRKKIPTIIRRQSTKKDLALDLAIENALRKDFAPIEKAKSIFIVLCTINNVENDELRVYSLVTQVKLMNKRGIDKIENKKGNAIGLTDDDIFKCQKLLNLLAISENTALKYLRLLSLPKRIADKIVAIDSNESLSKRRISEGYITVTQGYELSRIKEDKIRNELYKKTVKNKWNSITLRSVVDELIEYGKATQINALGSSKRRGEEDHGIESLTTRCFNLSSSLWNFRKKIPIIPLCLEKLVWRASLKKLRKHCLNLVSNINDLLENEANLRDNVSLVNEELEIIIRPGAGGQKYRFGFPYKQGDRLGLKPGDRIKLALLSIKKAK